MLDEISRDLKINAIADFRGQNSSKWSETFHSKSAQCSLSEQSVAHRRLENEFYGVYMCDFSAFRSGLPVAMDMDAWRKAHVFAR